MTIPHNKITLKPDPEPAPDQTEQPTTPLAQAEALLSKFRTGGWFLSRSATGSTADNRTALMAGLKIAELRQAQAQHAELMDVFSRIAAALENKIL